MNNTLIAMALAAGVGLGVFLMLRAMRRRPQALSDKVQGLRQDQRYLVTPLTRLPDDELSGIQKMLGRSGLRVLSMFGLGDSEKLREQLRILDRSMERHAYEKMAAGLAGILLPLLVGMVLAANGSPISPLLLFVAILVFGPLGFLYPDLPLSEKVNHRQQAFRHSLSSYLDLVSIILAGGGGTESALLGAAEGGDSWVFGEIRQALRRGELTGRTPWEMFEELGIHYGVDELRELAASISLAGGQGARVRQSLIAKSEALRAQQSAEIEGQAESNTEKMIVPVALMVLALMVFIGRGAVDAISGEDPGANSNETAEDR